MSRVVGPWTGNRLLQDREDTLVGLPLALQGGVQLPTSAGLRADTSKVGMSFVSASPLHAVVAAPVGGAPGFAADWALEGTMPVEGGATWELYGHDLSSGEQLLPAAGRGAAQAQGYSLFLVPARVNASTEDGMSSSDSLVALDSLHAGGILPNHDTLQQLQTVRSGTPVYATSGSDTVKVTAPGVYVVYKRDSTCGEARATGGFAVVKNALGQLDTLLECLVSVRHDTTLTGASLIGLIPTDSVGAIAQSNITGATKVHLTTGQPFDPRDAQAVIRGSLGTPPYYWYRSDTAANGLPVSIRLVTTAPTQLKVWVENGRVPSPTWLTDSGWIRAGQNIPMDSGRSLGLWVKWVGADTIVIPAPGVPDERRRSQVVYVGGVSVPRGPLGWKAQELKIRGLGGDRSMASTSWSLSNLDVQALAGDPITSWSWKLAVRSASGTSSGEQQAVLTLGAETVKQTVDPLGNPLEVVLTHSARLSDLAVQAVNRDSVTVDIKTFKAIGRALVMVRNRGAQALQNSFDLVLFEDRNADFAWQQGADSLLGRMRLNPLMAHHDTVIELPIQTTLAFPDNAFLAVVDPEAQVADIDRNNNLDASRSVCRKWNERSFQVDDTVGDLRARIPALNQRVPYGVPLQGVRRRDTDHDGRITELDSLDAMAVLDGHLTVWNGVSGAVELYLPATDLKTVRVDDVDGDGVPEFVIENTVWGKDGLQKWGSAAQGWVAPSSSIDLDGDGVLDSTVLDGNCQRIVSGATVRPIWESNGCSDRQTSSQALATVPVGRSSCYDLGVWPLVNSAFGIQVRLANTGSSRLDAGLPVFVDRMQGTQVLETWMIQTSRGLKTGEWLDLEVGQGRNVSPQNLRVRVDLLQTGRIDRNSQNNQTTFPVSGGQTP